MRAFPVSIRRAELPATGVPDSSIVVVPGFTDFDHFELPANEMIPEVL